MDFWLTSLAKRPALPRAVYSSGASMVMLSMTGTPPTMEAPSRGTRLSAEILVFKYLGATFRMQASSSEASELLQPVRFATVGQLFPSSVGMRPGEPLISMRPVTIGSCSYV